MNETPKLRELSLFSGAGGGLLASKHLLGWETIGYVEFNDYCQRVIAQRIKDGLLDDAPIFGDIRAFLSEGYAASYTGLVDVVSGGFPCQPFSDAGLKLAELDARNMWPATLSVLEIIRPKSVFLENVRGLVSTGYIGNVLGGLASIGYHAGWCNLSASFVGAPHLRERIWIVAHTERRRLESWFQRCAWASTVKSSKNYRSRHGFKYGEAWRPEPDIRLLDDGLAYGMDRLTAIGNGQVPICAATAWRILSGLE